MAKINRLGPNLTFVQLLGYLYLFFPLFFLRTRIIKKVHMFYPHFFVVSKKAKNPHASTSTKRSTKPKNPPGGGGSCRIRRIDLMRSFFWTFWEHVLPNPPGPLRCFHCFLERFKEEQQGWRRETGDRRWVHKKGEFFERM